MPPVQIVVTKIPVVTTENIEIPLQEGGACKAGDVI